MLATQGTKQVVKHLGIAAFDMTTSFGERAGSGAPWSDDKSRLEFNANDFTFNWDVGDFLVEP
jgi:hypothetical protein